MSPQPYSYGDTVLKVENVSARLGETMVLRDLNMEIKNIQRPGLEQGQVVALLGPSGIGKTTLFRILAGLSAPDTGTVRLHKEGFPVQRGMVGVVAQSYPLFPHRTVLGNLAVAGRQAGMSGSESAAKARDLLKRFGLEEHGAKYPVQLSGGQRQRVAIAQQFMCSDYFLLMDEPFSGLDLIAIENLCRFISEMALTHELKTFIVVTHDVEAAVEIADTVWLLGRDRDEQGNIIPGAKVKASYNLAERGLAWRDGITQEPEYLELLREIRAMFPKL